MEDTLNEVMIKDSKSLRHSGINNRGGFQSKFLGGPLNQI